MHKRDRPKRLADASQICDSVLLQTFGSRGQRCFHFLVFFRFRTDSTWLYFFAQSLSASVCPESRIISP